MAVNKNFVVKNGLEVDTNLIIADANTNRVGIGTTVPQYTLHVFEGAGIGATNVYVTGITTVVNELRVGTSGTVFSVIAGPTGFGQSVGVGTAAPAYLLDVRSPVSTGQTALYVQGDVRITGDLSVDDITFDDATLSNLTVTEALFVGGSPGISTFVGFTTFQDYVFIQDGLNVSGFATASAFYIDGTSVINNSRQLQNIASLDATTTATIEAAIANGPNTFTDLKVTGVSTFVGLATFNGGLQVVSGVTTLGTVKVSSGIITATSGIVTYYGDGSYLTGNARNLTATIGIGTSGVAVGYGVSFLDLRGPGLSTVFYNNDVGIATIYFQGGGSGSASIGIGTTPGEAFVGVVTSGNLWYNSNLGRMFIYYQDVDSAQWVDASPSNVGVITSLINVSFAPGSAVSPSMYFIGDQQTGFFSPGAGQFTFVSTGSSVLNINASGINVTGIITSTSISTGNINSSGVITATDFDSLSDVRYKENINTVESALSKVDQLRGVKFDWKESGLPSYGVIAQELEEILPELVHGHDPKTVNYNGIIGVLIEAIKELKAEVEELKNNK